MHDGEHPAQRGGTGLQLVGAFETPHAGALEHILRVVLIPAKAQGERPEPRQHARQQTGQTLDICC
ncbi:hypothetical protein BGLA2_1570019 [Burkholderia gladioli]|nr:hypothetical protein BGLA2_1570019 [Burkholderia gladioli]